MAQSKMTGKPLSGTGEAPDVRRINVNFSVAVCERIEEMAKRRGTTVSEVLRGAVELERWLEDELSSGTRISVERNGERQEVVFPDRRPIHALNGMG